MELKEKQYKVKICGTASVRDALMADKEGADYLGVLVDVPYSRRTNTIKQAAEIVQTVNIPVVTLLSDKSEEEIQDIVNKLHPFAVHILRGGSPQMISNLKNKLTCQVWPTVYLPARGQGKADINTVKRSMREFEKAGADSIVIDTVVIAKDGSKGSFGGTGKTADWDAGKELVKAVNIPVFLAGGINPNNVKDAVRKVDPYGVDLASGVEKTKCNRDPEKVKRLMQEVRKASKLSADLVTHNPESTRRLAAEIGRLIFPGSLIALCGNLGSGKTVFAQGLAQGLDVNAIVTSPTFVIINEYEGRIPFYHIDTYRLDSSDEMMELGYEEYFYGDGLTAIEWAQKIEDLLPEEYLKVELKVVGESDREISLIPYGSKYIELVKSIEYIEL